MTVERAMWIESLVRSRVRRLLVKQRRIALTRQVPSLESKFQDIDEFGLYLHVPFCRQICPYCPYNKELYQPEAAERYARAVIREIDVYSRLMAGRPVRLAVSVFGLGAMSCSDSCASRVR